MYGNSANISPIVLSSLPSDAIIQFRRYFAVSDIYFDASSELSSHEFDRNHWSCSAGFSVSVNDKDSKIFQIVVSSKYPFMKITFATDHSFTTTLQMDQFIR